MSSSGDVDIQKRRKRGSESVSRERKRLRNSGQSYKTYKQKDVPEKQPAKAHLNLKNGCFLDFYKCTLEQQGTFLLGLMQLGVVKRRRHGKYDDPAQSRRQTTVYYTVPNGNGSHVQVCRKIFSDIFALSRFCKRKRRKENAFILIIGENTVHQESIQKKRRSKYVNTSNLFP
ncbi:hypothetical protein C0J52_09611 [Blattella germanica]|nr:hypothetical protein C0J52_09611 [Blattella germanica]